jgi:rRNA processing protein Krr1/Pno1
VYCKVDARHGSIEVGDLLTTSDTPGHAMKATDSLKAFGSVIGKALRPLKEGQALIPILIALQ